MKSYISYIYEMDLHENECNPPLKPSYLENVLYEELKTILNKEHLHKMDKLINTLSERYSSECEIYFKKGFRFAMRLVLECFNEKDTKRGEYYENLF